MAVRRGPSIPDSELSLGISAAVTLTATATDHRIAGVTFGTETVIAGADGRRRSARCSRRPRPTVTHPAPPETTWDRR